MKRTISILALAAVALAGPVGCKSTPAPPAAIPPPNEAAIKGSQPKPRQEYEYKQQLRIAPEQPTAYDRP